MLRRPHRLWQLGLAVLAAAPVVASAQPPRASTVRVTTTDGGVVTSADRKIDCGDDCAARYRRSGVVRLTAAPLEHFAFAGWRGACFGTAPRCAVALRRGTATARAAFERLTGSVAVTVSGPGAITGAGIDCGAATTACTASGPSGSTVTLTAAPDADGEFARWGGACAAATGLTCDLMLVPGAQVTAAFAQDVPDPGDQTLSVTPERTRVTSDPPGVDCTSDCTAGFPSGTVLTLTAGRATWEGGCRGVGSSCLLVVDTTLGVIARSAANPGPPEFGVNVSVAGRGRVTGAGIRCTPGGTLAACRRLFPSGAAVTLRAAPRRRFVGWGGFCTQRRPQCTVYATAAKTVYATFRR